MKCVSYDYDFEMDLVAKWKALDRSAPRPPDSRLKRNSERWRKFLASITDDSEDEDEVPTRRSRDHLSRKARCKKGALQGDSASAIISGSELTSDEDGEDLYHDADVGDLSG